MSVVRFEEFELDEQTFELRRNATLLRVQQQPARVLAFLMSHQGKPVTRQQIQDAIWGQDTFVDFEQNLNFCVRQIRITLGDQTEKPRFIETQPRIGYPFGGAPLGLSVLILRGGSRPSHPFATARKTSSLCG